MSLRSNMKSKSHSRSWLFITLILCCIVDVAVCGDCSDIQSMTSATGSIGDGSGDYLNDALCVWYIKPTEPGLRQLSLSFSSFSTLSDDKVYVYDGNTTSSPLLLVHSGSSIPSIVQGSPAYNPTMLVVFQSDGNGVAAGFQASYSSAVCMPPQMPEPPLAMVKTLYRYQAESGLGYRFSMNENGTIAVFRWVQPLSSVHIYRRDGNGGWILHQVLSVAGAGVSFGDNVVINDNNVIAVAAPTDGTTPCPPASNCGAVYIYTYDAGADTWVKVQQLQLGRDTTLGAIYSGARFGTMIALNNNNIIAVGYRECGDIHYRGGAVYMYKQASSSNWVLAQRWGPSDGSGAPHLGERVYMNNNNIVIADTTHAATASYVYAEQSPYVWTEVKKYVVDSKYGKLYPSGINDKNEIAQTSYYYQVGNDIYGHVHILVPSGTNDWITTQILTRPDPYYRDWFGRSPYSVAMNQYGHMIIGDTGDNAPGGISHAYVYRHNQSNPTAYSMVQNLKDVVNIAYANPGYFGADSVLTKTGYVAVGTHPASNSLYLGRMTCPNGYTFHEANQSCILYNPFVESITPNLGPTSGDTLIDVNGVGFDLFGSSCTPTMEITGSGGRTGSVECLSMPSALMLKCQTPSWPVSETVIMKLKCGSRQSYGFGSFMYYKQPTPLSATPNYGIESGGTVITVSISEKIPYPEKYMTVKLSDSNGNSVYAPAHIDNTTWDTVTFITPKFNFTTVEMPTLVTIFVAPNGQQYTPTSQSFLTYYKLPVVYSVSPTKYDVVGGSMMTINGTGFLNSTYLAVSFENGVFGENVLFVNGETVTCTVPTVYSALTVQPTVTLDRQSYSKKSAEFAFTAPFSKWCRSNAEIELFQKDRELANVEYFDSLSTTTGTIVSTSLLNHTYASDGMVPAQTVDGDRCCELTLANDGFKCGSLLSRDNPTGFVEITLPHLAYVNEIIVAWSQPCSFMAKQYSVELRNVTGELVESYSRKSWQGSPCTMITGDSVTVSLCANFFKHKIAQKVKVYFDNTGGNFLAGGGGWITEVEVHGIFLKTPYRLVSTNSSTLVVKSAYIASIPAILVKQLTIFDEQVNPNDPEASRSLFVQLFHQGANASQYLLPFGQDIQGHVSVNSLKMIAPPAGLYTLRILGNGLKHTEISIQVVPGNAVSIDASISPADYVCDSRDHVVLKSIDVKGYDAGGNWCYNTTQTQQLSIVNAPAGLRLSGVTQVNMVGCVGSFDGIILSRPVRGTYNVSIVSSTGTSYSTVVSVRVTVGPPRNITLDPITKIPMAAVDSPVTPAPRMTIYDVNGILVSGKAVQVSAQMQSCTGQVSG